MIYYYSFLKRDPSYFYPCLSPFYVPIRSSIAFSPNLAKESSFLLAGADSTEPFSTWSNFSALLSRALRYRSMDPLGWRLKISTNSIAIFLSLILRRGVTMRVFSSWWICGEMSYPSFKSFKGMVSPSFPYLDYFFTWTDLFCRYSLGLMLKDFFRCFIP